MGSHSARSRAGLKQIRICSAYSAVPLDLSVALLRTFFGLRISLFGLHRAVFFLGFRVYGLAACLENKLSFEFVQAQLQAGGILVGGLTNRLTPGCSMASCWRTRRRVCSNAGA